MSGLPDPPTPTDVTLACVCMCARVGGEPALAAIHRASCRFCDVPLRELVDWLREPGRSFLAEADQPENPRRRSTR